MTSAIFQQKVKEMDIGEQEWHEDPLPGLGVQEESDESSSDSETDTDSESKPGRCPLA